MFLPMDARPAGPTLTLRLIRPFVLPAVLLPAIDAPLVDIALAKDGQGRLAPRFKLAERRGDCVPDGVIADGVGVGISSSSCHCR